MQDYSDFPFSYGSSAVLLTDVGNQQHGKIGSGGETNQIRMKEEDEKEED